MLNNIRIILVATTHPGNIGAAARAMKAMKLARLYLVRPKMFPHVDATARAAGADDILATAKVTKSLEEALSGCHLVVGASARTRDLPLSIVTPHQAANKVIETIQKVNSEVAIVFGRESSGLTNEELQLCHYHLHIPTNPDFSSLNLAAAVQVVVYEIMQVYLQTNSAEATILPSKDYDTPATFEEMQLFYAHLQQALIDIGYLNSDNPRKLMPRLRRLFNRIHLEHLEVNILRGVLAAIQMNNDKK